MFATESDLVVHFFKTYQELTTVPMSANVSWRWMISLHDLHFIQTSIFSGHFGSIRRSWISEGCRFVKATKPLVASKKAAPEGGPEWVGED